MTSHILTGFGFGPIQAGLFASEAYKSGNFERIVIAEIDQELVDTIRSNDGSFTVNVASSTGVTVERIDGIEIFNPLIKSDKEKLISSVSQSTEIVTSLPSVHFYETGKNSVASLIAQGRNRSTEAAIIYTAENNNNAAEILRRKVQDRMDRLDGNMQFLNTVIGKMSQVVSDKDDILDKNLRPITPGFNRAFLVEEFNKILVSECRVKYFTPGIQVFVEKEDLLPFEEAKLFGHNAVHVLLAFLGSCKGYQKMAEISGDNEIMRIAHDAFINEIGTALVRKYASLNEYLFTDEGFRLYAEDLLNRMINPYLDDTIERTTRDIKRKLGLNDRVFGTMALCMEERIDPENMAKAAAAGLKCFIKQSSLDDHLSCRDVLHLLWQNDDNPYKEAITQKVESYFSSY